MSKKISVGMVILLLAIVAVVATVFFTKSKPEPYVFNKDQILSVIKNKQFLRYSDVIMDDNSIIIKDLCIAFAQPVCASSVFIHPSEAFGAVIKLSNISKDFLSSTSTSSSKSNYPTDITVNGFNFDVFDKFNRLENVQLKQLGIATVNFETDSEELTYSYKDPLNKGTITFDGAKATGELTTFAGRYVNIDIKDVDNLIKSYVEFTEYYKKLYEDFEKVEDDDYDDYSYSHIDRHVKYMKFQYERLKKDKKYLDTIYKNAGIEKIYVDAKDVEDNGYNLVYFKDITVTLKNEKYNIKINNIKLNSYKEAVKIDFIETQGNELGNGLYFFANTLNGLISTHAYSAVFNVVTNLSGLQSSYDKIHIGDIVVKPDNKATLTLKNISIDLKRGEFFKPYKKISINSDIFFKLEDYEAYDVFKGKLNTTKELDADKGRYSEIAALNIDNLFDIKIELELSNVDYNELRYIYITRKPPVDVTFDKFKTIYTVEDKKGEYKKFNSDIVELLMDIFYDNRPLKKAFADFKKSPKSISVELNKPAALGGLMLYGEKVLLKLFDVKVNGKQIK